MKGRVHSTHVLKSVNVLHSWPAAENCDDRGTRRQHPGRAQPWPAKRPRGGRALARGPGSRTASCIRARRVRSLSNRAITIPHNLWWPLMGRDFAEREQLCDAGEEDQQRSHQLKRICKIADESNTYAGSLAKTRHTSFQRYPWVAISTLKVLR